MTDWFERLAPVLAHWGLFVVGLLALGIAWQHIIALKGEQIRSLCVVTLIAVLAYCLGRFNGTAEAPWYDPMWLLAAIAMVTLAMISWGAQYAKMKVAQMQVAVGRNPDAAAAMFADKRMRPAFELTTSMEEGHTLPDDDPTSP